MLATAKVFVTGNSQAIRLPKAFRLDSEEVWISKSTDGILTIQPKPKRTRLRHFWQNCALCLRPRNFCNRVMMRRAPAHSKTGLSDALHARYQYH